MSFKVGQRLVAAFVLVLALGIGLALYNHSNSLRVTSLTAHLVEKDIPTLQGIDDLKIAIVRQEPILYEYYATMDESRFVAAHTQNESRIARGLALLRDTFPGRSELTQIDAHHARMRALADALHVTMSAAGGVDWDKAREVLAENSQEAGALNILADSLLQSLRTQVQNSGNSTQDAMQFINSSVVTFGCALLLFTILAGYSIRAYFRESRERQRLTLFPLRNPNPIISVDSEARVVFANPGADAALARLGLGVRQYDQLLPDDLRERVARLRRESKEGVEESDYAVGQAIFHCKITYLPDVALTYIYLADVTEARAAAEAMRTAKEAAEAASLSKSQFLANMSHEIRTPMNGVLGMTELLLHTPLNAEQRKLTETIERSGTSLLAIINDVLDISKIEAGKLTLERTPFSVQIVVEDSLQLIRENAHSKGLAIESTVDAAIPRYLTGDPLRLQQVLVNLLGNAVKFTHEGSIKLRVDLRCIDTAQATLRIEVEDSGIGIAPAEQAGIFEAFRQADGSTTRRYGGTGLGLSISRQLARALATDLRVESMPGQGARFWLEPVFDRCDADNTGQRSNRSTESMGTDARADDRPLRVLLVEDNPVNQTLSAQMLRLLGCEHQLARNGREAVELAQGQMFDLILMDCQMPEMDGLEATRVIRSQSPAGFRIPIIALTANALEGDKERCLAAGMDDYLSKPFKKQQLSDKLRLWAARKRDDPSPRASIDP